MNHEERILSLLESVNENIQTIHGRLDGVEAGQAKHGMEFAKIVNRLDTMDARFDKIDGRLNTMDERFDRIDGRLDTMDERVDKIDGRLDTMDGRFDKIDERLDTMDERFDKIDECLDTMDEHFDTIETKLTDVSGTVDAIFEHTGQLTEQQADTRLTVKTLSRVTKQHSFDITELRASI